MFRLSSVDCPETGLFEDYVTFQYVTHVKLEFFEGNIHGVFHLKNCSVRFFKHGKQPLWIFSGSHNQIDGESKCSHGHKWEHEQYKSRAI